MTHQAQSDNVSIGMSEFRSRGKENEVPFASTMTNNKSHGQSLEDWCMDNYTSRFARPKQKTKLLLSGSIKLILCYSISIIIQKEYFH